MILRTKAGSSMHSLSTRPAYRTRKPKLGAEARGIVPPLESAASLLPGSSPMGEKTSPETHTHFAITLHRSAIGLPARTTATLEALGIHRRMQTVYHSFSPDIAGKILAVKELVEVRNVPASQVRTPEEARQERKAVRGYEVQTRARPSGFVRLNQAVHASRVEKQ